MALEKQMEKVKKEAVRPVPSQCTVHKNTSLEPTPRSCPECHGPNRCLQVPYCFPDG